ncbi:MAG: hypothetical protein IPK19_01595 [Chloroflexi bacterium]|nr:hypothetical protein [Chloroflexota bacterium]
MQLTADQSRAAQLISAYAPYDPPRLPLDVGDLWSLLWRLDRTTRMPNRERYYRSCALALCRGMGLEKHPIYRFIDQTPAGEVYQLLPTVVYRVRGRSLDAHDQKAAVEQLVRLRDDILRIGVYPESWANKWPGSGIQDVELRERVFAVLFTALNGQFGGFVRMLLVIDIVVANLLIDIQLPEEIALGRLIKAYQYPDPADAQMRDLYLVDELTTP